MICPNCAYNDPENSPRCPSCNFSHSPAGVAALENEPLKIVEYVAAPNAPADETGSGESVGGQGV
jgi:hypothetical protein